MIEPKQIQVELYECDSCQTRIAVYEGNEQNTTLICVKCGEWMSLLETVTIEARNVEEDQDFYTTAFYPEDEANKILTKEY